MFDNYLLNLEIAFSKWFQKIYSQQPDMEDPKVLEIYEAYSSGWWDSDKQLR